MDITTTSDSACQFLSLPQVLDLVPVGRSTLYAWVADGHFPPPYKIGPRRVAWRRGDVAAWLNSRRAAC